MTTLILPLLIIGGIITAIIIACKKTHSAKPALWVFICFALTPIGALIIYAIICVARKDDK